jgi:hypothetical protein
MKTEKRMETENLFLSPSRKHCAPLRLAPAIAFRHRGELSNYTIGFRARAP